MRGEAIEVIYARCADLDVHKKKAIACARTMDEGGSVKRGNEVLRLRDKDGNPEWVGWKKTSD
jgi:hypothetical protein